MADTQKDDLVGFVEDAQQFAVGVGELAQSLPGISSAYNAACRVWSGTPAGRLFDLVNLGNVCTPYLQEDGRTFGTEEPAGFTGGQCAGTTYDVRVQWIETQNLTGNVTNKEFTGRGVGPFNGAEIGPDPVDGNGTAILFDFAGSISVGPRVDSGAFGSTQSDLVIVSVTGSPDDCGDPPPVFVPGDGYDGEEFGTPQDIVGPDGVPRSINVLSPRLDINGTLSIPVTVDGIQIDIGGGGAGKPPPVSRNGPTDDGPPLSGGGDDGERGLPEPPEGAVCVAISFAVEGQPQSVGMVMGSAPPVRTFGVMGNVCLKLTTSVGTSYWGEDTLLQNTRTLVAIPVEGVSVTAYRINLKSGMTYVATPIYRFDDEE